MRLSFFVKVFFFLIIFFLYFTEFLEYPSIFIN